MTAPPELRREPDATLAALRAGVLAIFLLGSLVLGVELLLMGHTKGIWQLVPLLLIGVCYLALASQFLFPSTATVRIVQVSLILFLVGGLAGLVLHYKSKAEFKLEVDPSLSGWKLFQTTMTGASLPPVLAPGLMIQLGLVGLAYTYRHPAQQMRT